jgi:hypothetical protein
LHLRPKKVDQEGRPRKPAKKNGRSIDAAAIDRPAVGREPGVWSMIRKNPAPHLDSGVETGFPLSQQTREAFAQEDDAQTKRRSMTTIRRKAITLQL